MPNKTLLSLQAFANANLRTSVMIVTITFALFPTGARTQNPMFETGVISSYNISGYIQSAYPVIDRMSNGRLVCVFSYLTDSSSTKFNIAFATSDDNGRSWSKPEILFNHPNAPDADPNLIVDGERILAFSTTVSEPGIDRTDIYMRTSKDGRHWSKEVNIDKPYRYISGKIHRGHRLIDGTLIMGYAWDAWAEQGMPPSTEGEMDNRAGVLRSSDGGNTWLAGNDIPYPEQLKRTSPWAAGGLCEPATVVFSDRTIMALVRTPGTQLYQTWSKDNGLNWETPRPSGLTAHNSPAALWKIDNSSDIIVVWDNSPVGRNPLTVALSIDRGKTWSSPKILVNTGGPQASYPSVVQSENGMMIVVWQQNVDKGREVRVARFNREWLLSSVKK